MGIENGSYEVFGGDAAVGEVRVRRDGLFTELDCVCMDTGEGVRRLYAVCGRSRVSLGVLVPSGGELRLRKRFSENELKRLGIMPPVGFTITPERRERGWESCREPWALFTDGYLRDVCRRLKGALVRRDGDTSLLAVPVYTDAPFPMMPAFCFGEPEDIGGREYIVFGIKNGELIR